MIVEIFLIFICLGLLTGYVGTCIVLFTVAAFGVAEEERAKKIIPCVSQKVKGKSIVALWKEIEQQSMNEQVARKSKKKAKRS